MYDDFDYEPYENDLEELGNREAWEDAQAEMKDGVDEYDEYWESDERYPEVDEDTGDCIMDEEEDFGDHPWDNER